MLYMFDYMFFIDTVWDKNISFFWVVGIGSMDCVHITMAQETSTVPEVLNLGGPDSSGSL